MCYPCMLCFLSVMPHINIMSSDYFILRYPICSLDMMYSWTLMWVINFFVFYDCRVKTSRPPNKTNQLPTKSWSRDDSRASRTLHLTSKLSTSIIQTLSDYLTSTVTSATSLLSQQQHKHLTVFRLYRVWIQVNTRRHINATTLLNESTLIISRGICCIAFFQKMLLSSCD